MIIDFVKQVTAVVDPFAGPLTPANFRYVPGSEVTYTLTLTITGGVATDLRIVDPIPLNTVYKANTIILNGAAKTDVADGDEADFDVSQSNAVTAELGDVAAPFTAALEFTVIVD